VNEETSIDIAPQHRLFDLIERNNDWNEVRLIKSEREVRAGHHPWNGNALASDLLARHRL
jgi:hypothetical protein